MAYGKPVVSTTLGVEGIEVKDGENILIADTPEEFVKKIILLHKDKKLYEKISTNARKLVEEKYSWKTIAENLKKFYRNLLEKNNTHKTE